ncbi:adhesion and hyphal regulator 1 [Achaetomium macrosporum]|uniref:Adhesion and hyphal regulator 1 n=1 Tax=Achaetomium macrosporum TaxID=79813 RepID=A0AAN7C8F6_9PEZI|nr:adhesion and hyphal regulator 1 [Achaetomium macrosporum]
MGDYYQHFLSSMMGVGGQPYPGQMAQPPVVPVGGSPAPNPYQSLGYFTGFPEPIMFNAPKAQRSRRKSAPGFDHIKHRRTRSGCYTCRSRRVKCDETHPICERCRKGKRECIYPEPPQPRGSGNSGPKNSPGPSQQPSPSSSRGDDDDDDVEQDAKLDPIMDEDEDEPRSATSQTSTSNFPLRRSSTTSSFSRQRVVTEHRQGSETPSFEGNKSSSPALSSGTTTRAQTPSGLHFPDASTITRPARPDWTFLPHELQFYLSYFYENISHYHYCMVNDADDFFQTVLIGLALRNDALLYAVVGFSAYHHAMKNPNGRINDFLQYYSHSVTLLLECLKKEEKYSIGTLLTILQLATIEEYLGDWVNLMGHQKAAFEVLTHNFTAQSIMQTPLGRVALMWYARFDLFIGIMGSFGTSLSREWYLAPVEYYEARAAAEPHNVGWKIEACSARLRLNSMEMCLLFAKGAKREVTEEEYSAEHRKLSAIWDNWKESWDPALTDAAFLVAEFPGNQALDPDDIVNPFAPGVLFRPPLFASTLMKCEYHSIALMHASQSAGKLTEEDRARLMEHAYAVCQICETVELWPNSPAGSLILLHSCLAIAALYLPQDARHHMWVRRKLALLETMGYISPVTMRTRMAQLFGDDSCLRWWLPDDEGFSPLLQNIRAIADERNAMALSTQRESLQQIRHVFSRMQIGPEDGPTQGDDAARAGGKDEQTMA